MFGRDVSVEYSSRHLERSIVAEHYSQHTGRGTDLEYFSQHTWWDVHVAYYKLKGRGINVEYCSQHTWEGIVGVLGCLRQHVVKVQYNICLFGWVPFPYLLASFFQQTEGSPMFLCSLRNFLSFSLHVASVTDRLLSTQIYSYKSGKRPSQNQYIVCFCYWQKGVLKWQKLDWAIFIHIVSQ